MADTALRPRRADDLGLRRALSDRLLPLLVAAMVVLAVLALAGALAARGLAAHWQGASAAMLTVQVPAPEQAAGTGARAVAVQAALAAASGVSGVRRLGGAELEGVLRPWLGEVDGPLALALPAVFEVTASPQAAASLPGLLDGLAPGTLVERNGAWSARLVTLARSLQACAALALATVAFVAVAVVAVATRAGLAGRRDAIDIVHGLGATDGMIAGRFAGRIAVLTAAGAVIGVGCAVPLLLGLASLTQPFQAAAGGSLAARLPVALWACLPVLPLLAGGIGWATAQATVRSWLAALP